MNKRGKNREIASEFLTGPLEELLDEKDITISSDDREGDESEARIFGSEYYYLEDCLVDVLDAIYPEGSEEIEDTDELPNEKYLDELCRGSSFAWKKKDSKYVLYNLEDSTSQLKVFDDLEDIVGFVAYTLSGKEEA